MRDVSSSPVTHPARRMARIAQVCVLILALTAIRVTAAGQEAGGDPDVLREEMRRMVAAARDRVFPALVHIQLVSSTYYAGKEIRHKAAGSGTIITPEGHVLTNQHVTNNGQRFRCTLPDKQEVPAELVGEDPLTDLAVLKLDLSALKDPGVGLPVAALGDSSELHIGDQVLAMGSPWALSRSVTLGIVSNTDRVFAGGLRGGDPDDMRLSPGQRTGLFTRWIQHDAAINPGNSGGPLVNLKGEVVGINEIGSLLGGNMGFAIPSNLAKQVAEELIAGGEIARSWIGLSFKPIEKTGLTRGVLVNSVVEDSPADKAGLQPGDLILRIEGKPITVRFPEEVPPLMKRIADEEIGASLGMTYERDDTTHQATVVTARFEKDRGEEMAFRSWGLTALEITPMAARERRLDSTDGVLVSGVRSGGGAAIAKPPLFPSDVINKIDGVPVRDLTDFIDRYEAIMDSDPLPEYLLVEFSRKGRNILTLLKPKPEKDEDPPPQVAKAWIGVAVQPVLKDLARRLGLDKQVGLRITRVYPRTLAAQSDLQRDDVITHLNGKRLKPKRREDAGILQRAIKKLKIGDTAELALVRTGQKRTVTVSLEPTRIRPDEAKRDRNRDFELTVREVTFFDRVDNRWEENVKGVIVVYLESAGWAGLGGVRPGDLIQRIDEFDVTDLDSYRHAIRTVTERKLERVVFAVLRGVRTRFQYLEPDWSPKRSPKKKENE